MTKVSVAALLAGLTGLVLGLAWHWLAVALLGVGLLIVVAIGALIVIRPSAVRITRQIQPPRVPKGEPAIAFLTFANTGRSSVGSIVAIQPFGDQLVRTVIPRMRRGEHGVRSYRLPTSRRGIFDVGPLEVTRRDPFDLFRISRRFGAIERIWVYPRVHPLKPLPVGQTRNLDGPSSDLAPQGTVTFHRLRDYVAGDDLRLVHWRSTARTGRLVVRHNVDTSQPYTVVLLDQRAPRYTADGFEAAIDLAASVLVSASADKAPVQLRLTDGAVLGGPRLSVVTPLIDQLTGLHATEDAGLRPQLLTLRRLRGGTSLVVITGELEEADLPYVSALRRRYERIVVISVSDAAAHAGWTPGVRLISGPDAETIAAAWNLQAVG